MALYLTESELEALDEGKQAEEYKARKEKEKEEEKNKDDKRKRTRYGKDDNSIFYTKFPGDRSRNVKQNFLFATYNTKDPVQKEDYERGKKVEEIMNKEGERTKDLYKDAEDKYDKAADDYYKHIKSRRPLFSKKAKEKYDRKTEELDKNKSKTADDFNNAIERHIKSDSIQTYDAVNRHIRRHPEQYKESAGIFESVEII